MTAGISVDLGSPVPPYEQIRTQISSLIAVGSLAAGTRLPTVRSLASDLGIAAGTVARAYRELEQSGVIETRRRNGTVVVGMHDAGGRPAAAPTWTSWPPSTVASRKAGRRASMTARSRAFCVSGLASVDWDSEHSNAL
jgi:GntR family transcriptional regulator